MFKSKSKKIIVGMFLYTSLVTTSMTVNKKINLKSNDNLIETKYTIIESNNSYNEKEYINLELNFEEKNNSNQQSTDILYDKNNHSIDMNKIIGRWFLLASNDPLDFRGNNVYYDVRYEEKGFNVQKWMYFEHNGSGHWDSENLRFWISYDKKNSDKLYLNTPKGLLAQYNNEIIYHDPEYDYVVLHYKENDTYKVYSRFIGDINLLKNDINEFQIILKGIKKLKDVKYTDKIKEIDKKNDINEIEIEKIENELTEDNSYFYIK